MTHTFNFAVQFHLRINLTVWMLIKKIIEWFNLKLFSARLESPQKFQYYNRYCNESTFSKESTCHAWKPHHLHLFITSMFTVSTFLEVYKCKQQKLRPYDIEHIYMLQLSTVRQQLLSVLVTSWCTKQLLSAHDFIVFCEKCFGIPTWFCSQTTMREKIVCMVNSLFCFVHCSLSWWRNVLNSLHMEII